MNTDNQVMFSGTIRNFFPKRLHYPQQIILWSLNLVKKNTIQKGKSYKNQQDIPPF